MSLLRLKTKKFKKLSRLKTTLFYFIIILPIKCFPRGRELKKIFKLKKIMANKAEKKK